MHSVRLPKVPPHSSKDAAASTTRTQQNPKSRHADKITALSSSLAAQVSEIRTTDDPSSSSSIKTLVERLWNPDSDVVGRTLGKLVDLTSYAHPHADARRQRVLDVMGHAYILMAVKKSSTTIANVHTANLVRDAFCLLMFLAERDEEGEQRNRSISINGYSDMVELAVQCMHRYTIIPTSLVFSVPFWKRSVRTAMH